MSLIKATPPISCSGLVSFSPNNEYIASVNVFKVQVYISVSSPLKLLIEHKFKDEISLIQWSYNSKYILVALIERNLCIVQSAINRSITYKVDEGLFGLVNAMFVPNKTDQIITLNSFNVRMTIWSLHDKTSHFITNPKFPNSKGIAFSSVSSFMCLAERRELSEHIGVYNIKDWSITNHFPVKSRDLQEIKITNDNDHILIVESEIYCIVYMYSISGELLRYIEPYVDKAGIKELQISPNGCLFSIGCMDGNAYLYYLNSELSFIDLLEHCTLQIDENVYILKESVIRVKNKFDVSVFNKIETPYRIETDENINKIENNIIIFTEWSSDSIYLATVNQLMPNVLWIWKIEDLSLQTIIIFENKITQVKTSNNNILMILCSCSRIFLFDFTKNNVTGYDTGFILPPKFLEWDIKGEKFIIGNNSNYLSCFITKENLKMENTNSQQFYASGGINNNGTSSNFYNDESASYSYFNNNFYKK